MRKGCSQPMRIRKNSFRRSRSAARFANAAAGFVLVHNHPSGDARPSVADVRLTQRVVKGARILEVECLDHVIAGGRIRKHPGYFSFQEAGLL
jgi:DNA repair protein RadC